MTEQGRTNENIRSICPRSSDKHLDYTVMNSNMLLKENGEIQAKDNFIIYSLAFIFIYFIYHYHHYYYSRIFIFWREHMDFFRMLFHAFLFEYENRTDKFYQDFFFTLFI